jgi:uncharacterized protein (DUF4213/DUF364 family)
MIPAAPSSRRAATAPAPLGTTPSFEAATLALLESAAVRLGPARVRALHLPPARPHDPLAGEFCALELEDGSLGLSYALFGDALGELRARAPTLAGAQALAIARGLAAPARLDAGLARTLGLAAANALTARLWRRCGYSPPPAADSIGGIDPAPGERVGMIGWFDSLVPRLLERGVRLHVIELREDLVGERAGFTVTRDASALAECTQVLATGTLLLNGTLEAMIASAPRARRFVLVGPSAGLLPDAPFERGVSAIGGTWVHDTAAFVDALRSGQSRSGAARKFSLLREGYPGLRAILGVAG